ncbi:MAG: hypothetical protein V3U43_10840, partial [Pseudomonadales bacterium]
RTARWGTGWQAGVDSADQVGAVIGVIKEATRKYERTIDEDHFGAGFGFRFGDPEEGASKAYIEALTKRLGRAPDRFVAIGDENTVMRRIHEFIDAGVHKFILRPIGRGTEEMIEQTKLLIEKVLPEVDALNRR